MMNTKLIGLVVAVLVVAGGYMAMSKNSAAPGAESADTKQSPAFSGSIQDLATRGGNWKCTVSGTADGAASNGTVYVSGSKLRADFTSTVPQLGNVESHMIADGTDMYVWTSAMPQGFKTKASITQGSSGASKAGVDLSKAYSYDCQPLSGDASLFVPPSTVTFTDFSSR